MISSSLYILVAVLISYLYLVRRRRFSLLQSTIQSCKDKSYMTPLEAQAIIHRLAMFDCPYIYTKSLEFGLLRTYAIPSIAKLLCATRDLVSETGVRVEETEILLLEIISWNLNSERSTTALARMNYIHAQYGSKITNDDLLYTLSVFILEPVKWINRHDWRTLDEREIHANYVLWRSVGERMQIRDIPGSYEACAAWSEEYERTHMVYDKKNEMLGTATLNLLLRPVPRIMRSFTRSAAISLLDQRLRSAFGYPAAPSWLTTVMHGVFGIRRLVLRHLAMPRTAPFLKVQAAKTEEGLYRRPRWSYVPLYVESTWLNRVMSFYYGLGALGHASRWHNEGYMLESVGPLKFREKGHREVRSAAEGMRKCPFS